MWETVSVISKGNFTLLLRFHNLPYFFIIKLNFNNAINMCLNGKSVFEVEDAGLAGVLDLRAGLTNFGLLKTHLRTRTPTENGERSEKQLICK
jgi:hypothetical protein